MNQQLSAKLKSVGCLAYECKVFDEALGREKGNPQIAAWCMMRALQRWESMPV